MNIETIANAALGVMDLAAFLFWIHAITNWDGSVSCDETQCDACPFPCDNHKKEGGTKK